MTKNSELFKIDGKVPFIKALPISLQHIFAMIIANVAPALIVSGALGLNSGDRIMLVQYCMFASGIATLMQIIGIWKFGSRLPLIMGMNFAFVPVVINIGLTYGMGAVYGSVIFGGIVTIILGSLVTKIRKYFPPLVTGTTVLTMGISLYPVAIINMAGTPGPEYGSLKNWIVSLSVLLIVMIINHFAKGYLKILSMLVGIAFGYILSLMMGMVQFVNVSDTPFFMLPSIFPFGVKFIPSAIITMIIMYLVTSIEVIGDVSSLTIGTENKEATSKQLEGAIMGKGVTAIIGTILGGMPTATFSQNVGIVTMTKVVARKIFIIAGIIILLVGFFPQFGLIMTSIPAPVIGGATLSVFAIITINGLKLISQEVLNERNATILGIALVFGLGLTSVPDATKYAPEAFKTFIGSSPVIISTIICFVLNILIPNKEK